MGMKKMVNTYLLGKISENGLGETNEINGEILKIVVITEKLYPNVKIIMKSLDEETLCDDYLNKEITRFYPKNAISISQEQVHVENFFVSGPLSLSVEGLGDGEFIENIIVYYK